MICSYFHFLLTTNITMVTTAFNHKYSYEMTNTNKKIQEYCGSTIFRVYTTNHHKVGKKILYPPDNQRLAVNAVWTLTVINDRAIKSTLEMEVREFRAIKEK